MASPFQQRALQRKLIYTGLILVLFTASLVWRKAVMDAQAGELAIREQSRGEVDLLGSIVRLGTIGSRGLATCVTWINAMDSQKKNQWNELELWVRTLTKMQPHFITPWIFQSWNLAYNVSVESDRVNDKYFYVTRGVGLLAEGERQNRDNPDIRWSIGFFTQHKIGQSDETNTMRSLSQLSMIPPNERDPGRFWTMKEGRQEIDLKEFEDFCKKHPQLVRRLREGIRRETKRDQTHQFRCEKADEVVQFLADNFRIPSLWEEPALPSPPGGWQRKTDKLRPLADRFPVLPPSRTVQPPQQLFDPSALTDADELRDDTDAFQVARAWYSYAQEPIPQPDKFPGSTQPIIDRVHQRIPRHMTTLIFRGHPAQAQRFSAERLYDDGWYDETPWDIPDWFEGDKFWYNEQGERLAKAVPAQIGGGKPWGRDAWSKAYELWRRLGEESHLLLSPAEQENMEQLAREFGKHFNLSEASPIPALREDTLDQTTRDEFFAWRFMRDYGFYRQVSNFPHHYYRSFIETKEETIKARKLFYEAETLRLKNSAPRALAKYQDPNALTGWRDNVLLRSENKEFRRDYYIQEQNFELQMKYVELYAQLHGNAFKAGAARLVFLPMCNPPGAGVCPVAFTAWAAPLIRQDKNNPLLGGPFDVSDSDGVPLIAEEIRMQVLRRLYPGTYKAEPPPNLMERMKHPTAPKR
jgi:hypothetical protein